MPMLLRVLVLAAVLGGLIGAGIAVADRADPSPGGQDAASLPMPTAVVAADPVASSAEQAVEGDRTVVRYALAAGDALVIRLSGDAFASCDFKVHPGPRRSAAERVRLGIDVDYLIVPADAAESVVTALARACAEYWTTTD